MNLSEWQAMSGAYMPSWEARMEIAISNLPPDLYGRYPVWFVGYALHL
jgi:hypothetical protein